MTRGACFSENANSSDGRPRSRMSTVVMTGGTSGLGAIAAERLTRTGDVRLILGARHGASTGAGASVALDLASLDSVRAFADCVRGELGDTPIDALILNAGVIHGDVEGRTVDGFERTFAINHLAHYLLLRLLLPALADGAVVVLTTSGTHDPGTGAGLVPPRHADAALLAHPERDPEREIRPGRAAQHAYTASKLCAILTAGALMKRGAEQRQRLTAVAYCPGQVFGTGLARDLRLPMRLAWSLLGTPVLGWPVRRLNGNLNSRSAAGKALADLARGVAGLPPGCTYAALRRGRLTWPTPSVLARRDELALALWDDSARLVGITEAACRVGAAQSLQTRAPQRPSS